LARRIAVLLIAIGVARIVSTYWILNHTIDEIGYISAGLEWVTAHTYTYQPEQPPLSPAAAGIGAWLAGARNVSRAELPYKGPDILYHSPSYYRTLAAARAGELPFFIGAALMVWLWARRLHGNLAALAAVLLFTTMPVVLGHAGLATTDISLCATLPAALYAFLLWIENPGTKRSVLLGLAIAAGVLSKFSFLLYFPVSVLVIIPILRKWRLRIRPLILVLAIAVFVIWAGYWFTVSPLLQGLRDLQEHAHTGHPDYLLGEQRRFGWWYFFPVVFAYKTPLAFLALAGIAWICLHRSPREQWIPWACAAAIMVAAMPSTINLGVRHIIPIYPLLAIPAGLAAARLIESTARAPRILGGFLVLWQLTSSILVHPDYIAYFNEFAGGRPELVRVDSDLDWGQAINELVRSQRARGINRIGWGGVTNADINYHGAVGWYLASKWERSTGWIAVNATERFLPDFAIWDGSTPRPWAWLDPYQPVERVGHGAILLYYIPPDH
jgi:4-amino-4-deoxy-L-arabinose transferase-like glycosyltransferase